MRYIKFIGGNGYCGCDIEEYELYDDSVTDEELDLVAEELARENGAMFEYVATGWGDRFESEEEEEDYYNSCWCNWEEITKEEYEEMEEE